MDVLKQKFADKALALFKENKEMNEMKPGERPDTIHIEHLPCKWFVNYQDKSGLAHDKPSDFVLKKAFSTFGDIKVVDIPMLDDYRHKMKKSVSGRTNTKKQKDTTCYE